MQLAPAEVPPIDDNATRVSRLPHSKQPPDYARCTTDFKIIKGDQR
jgi:hypothetical protein